VIRNFEELKWTNFIFTSSFIYSRAETTLVLFEVDSSNQIGVCYFDEMAYFIRCYFRDNISHFCN
jgi:hypothetical protein